MEHYSRAPGGRSRPRALSPHNQVDPRDVRPEHPGEYSYQGWAGSINNSIGNLLVVDGEVLAQVRAGDISSLESLCDRISPKMGACRCDESKVHRFATRGAGEWVAVHV